MGNLQTVQSMYEAFGRGDVQHIVDQCAEDVKWEYWDVHPSAAQTAGVPYLVLRQGKAGVAEFFALIGTYTFHDFRVVSMLEGDRKVAVELVTDIETDKGRVQDQDLHLFAFNSDGRVVWFREYVDTAKNIAAAGL